MATIQEPPRKPTQAPRETKAAAQQPLTPGEVEQLRKDRVHAIFILVGVLAVFVLLIVLASFAPAPNSADYQPWLMP